MVFKMTLYDYGYKDVEALLWRKFRKAKWYEDVLSYLLKRYYSIENRIIETFRYVDCHPSNRATFSYEYSSILRDAGSVFGSTMDRLVKETRSISALLDIRDYAKWLREEVENIPLIAAEINYPSEERLLLPFLPLNDEKSRLNWWHAYNEVKHSDIDKFHVGNFENALNSLAALAILLALYQLHYGGRLFPNIYYSPEKYPESLLFFKR